MVCICTYSKLKLTFRYRKTPTADSHVIDFQSKPIMLLYATFYHLFKYSFLLVLW